MNLVGPELRRDWTSFSLLEPHGALFGAAMRNPLLESVYDCPADSLELELNVILDEKTKLESLPNERRV